MFPGDKERYNVVLFVSESLFIWIWQSWNHGVCMARCIEQKVFHKIQVFTSITL